MSKSRERNAIYGVYNTVSWKRKVREMPDNQVHAIYCRFLADGKFDKPPVKKDEQYKQMTIFDYI